MSSASMLPRRTPDPKAAGPLKDIRIVDLSRLVAGNMVTHALGDFGADVIKIERPGKGDDLRNWRVDGHSNFWKLYGRNKRSLALDIRSGEGKEILIRLLKTADVMVENFVPGTLEEWGLGPEALHRINPKLIVVRVSGWGQTGPYAKRPGFGTLVEAMSGFAYMNGFPDKPPALPPLALADMIAGLYGAYAVMVALRAVEQGGQGQVIDLSLFEPILSIIGSEAQTARITGEAPLRNGNQSTHTAPRNVYKCSDGRYVAMSGSMQSMAERIFDTIGRSDLKTDPRFRTNDDRVDHRDELDAIIGAFIGAKTQAENLALFEAAGVTVGPICTIAELMTHPYVIGREVMVEVPDADLGSIPMPEVVPRLSRTPGAIRRAAPKVGQDNEEILAELARIEAKGKAAE